MRTRLIGWVDDIGRVDARVGDLLHVGSSSENDVVLRLPGVSRHHARIVRQDNACWIEDAGSRNGTSLNGKRVTRSVLQHLDVITLAGLVELVFLDPERRPVGTPAATPRVTLEWLDGPDAGRTQPVPEGETVFGRGSDCSVVVNVSAVSRAHARITVSGMGVTLQDLGSANGTRLNGQPITDPVPLRDDDEFQLGVARGFRIRVSAAEVPAGADVPLTVVRAAGDKEWRTRLISAEEFAVAMPGLAAFGGATSAPPASAKTQEDRQTGPVATPAPTSFMGGTLIAPPGSRPDATRAEALPDGASEGAPTTVFAPPDVAVPPSLLSDRATPSDESGAPGTRFLPVPIGSMVPPSIVAALPETMRAPLPGEPNTLPMAAFDRRMSMPPPVGAMPVAVLTGLRLSSGDCVVVVPQGRSIVGRGTDANVRIDNREVSQMHAALILTGDQAIVEDLASTNGTSVNGAALSMPRRLATGDRLSFGPIEFAVELIAES
jgi:pSer/pThr/pTyr-binding forkhead associated (FHA) protein